MHDAITQKPPRINSKKIKSKFHFVARSCDVEFHVIPKGGQLLLRSRAKYSSSQQGVEIMAGSMRARKLLKVVTPYCKLMSV